MEPSNIEFMGAPCGKHGPYTFYKAFKYSSEGKVKILCLGQFFYVKILKDARVCIGELQLLWEDRNHEGTQLSSVRLYFLPEHTPEGRQPRQGEDEVLAETEKVVLRVEDLITWIVTEPVTWPIGHLAIKENLEPQENGKCDDLLKVFAANNSGLNFKDVLREQESLKDEIEEDQGTEVVILGYPAYCRYRAILLRLEGCADQWMKNAIVSAIGGFTVKTDSARVMFCKDTFEHPDLEEHEFRQDWLAPNLKGRPRKKKMVQKKDDSDYCNSEESENSMDRDLKRMHSSSNARDSSKLTLTSHTQLRREVKMENSKPLVLLKPNNKERFAPEEENFLRKLYSFMRDRGSPIERIPTLGFREVDLYEFYSYGRKLGGYEEITQKRLWKHIYDKLGGHPANTSAATCTRRHYEKLLLPYERYEGGQDHKPLPAPYQKVRSSSDPSSEETPLPSGTLRIPTVTPSHGPLSQRNYRANHGFLEKERKWEEMRRMKNLNRDKQGAMVRRTVKAELLYRQQVKAEQHASTSQHFGGPGQPMPGVQPKHEPTEQGSSRQTKENHSLYPRNGALPRATNHYMSSHGHQLPSHGDREIKLEPGGHGSPDRPSVIQQGPKAAGKPVLNPAPAPRSHLPQTVYGPPHLMVATPAAASPSSATSKRPYPFTNSHTANHHGAPGNGATPSMGVKDLDPYHNNVKRPHGDHHSADKNHYTAKAKHYTNASSPIVIEDNDNDQPLDFSMKTMRKREADVTPAAHSHTSLPPADPHPEEGPVNLSVRSRHVDADRSPAQRYSPYHRPSSRSEAHVMGRPPSGEHHEGHKSGSQSQRPIPLSIDVPSSAMAAIVHPAFPQLSGSNMLPPGVVSPQMAQPFLYQAPLPGLHTVAGHQPKAGAALPASHANLPGGQALFLPTAPFVIPAAHLYPHLYGQAPAVSISQNTEH